MTREKGDKPGKTALSEVSQVVGQLVSKYFSVSPGGTRM